MYEEKFLHRHVLHLLAQFCHRGIPRPRDFRSFRFGSLAGGTTVLRRLRTTADDSDSKQPFFFVPILQIPEGDREVHRGVTRVSNMNTLVP